MKQLIKITLISLLSISLGNCQSKDQESMKEKLIESLQQEMKTYKERPVYGCQVNKYNCRLIIETITNDYRFIENNGESMMLPFNPMIIKSGLQKVKIKVYPFEGQEYIDGGANVQLKFYYAKDKDTSLSEYQQIAEFKLPENIGEMKIPYYEGYVEFKAKVPYDYSKELDNALDLEKIPNIEEKVVAKYSELRKLGNENNDASFKNLGIHNYILYLNSTYYNSLEDVKKAINGTMAICESQLQNKKILPIENYNIQFYANGKIVALWQKKMEPMMYVEGEFVNSEGELKKFEGGQPIFLYMPDNFKDLEIWSLI